MVSRVRELFSTLQEGYPDATLKWVVKSCASRILLRLKTCLEFNRVILDRLKSCKLTEDDRHTFETICPNGIPLKKHGLQHLGEYVAQRLPSNDPATANDRISVVNVEQWLNAVGDLPRVLYVILQEFSDGAKRPMQGAETPHDDLDYIIAIYLMLQRSIKLFTETKITRFLAQLPHLSKGNHLM